MHWKPKSSHDIPFTLVICNPIDSIAKVCLDRDWKSHCVWWNGEGCVGVRICKRRRWESPREHCSLIIERDFSLVIRSRAALSGSLFCDGKRVPCVIQYGRWPLARCNYWALEQWSMQLRNWVLSFISSALTKIYLAHMGSCSHSGEHGLGH